MNIKKILLSLLSGATVGLSFYDGRLWLLAPVGLTLFFYGLYEEKKGFVFSFLFGLSFYLVQISWALSLDISWLGLSFFPVLILRICIWLAISGAEAVLIGCCGAVCTGILKKSKKAVRPLATAGLWVFTEAIAGIPGYILSFAWGRICNSQYAFLPMVQSASLLGGLFVSGVIVYFAASAAICIREKSVRVLVPALCVMLLNLAYGTASLCIKRDGELYTVSVVQSGLTASQKWRMGAQEVLEHHIKLCDGASGKLIVMPESALPITLNKSTYTERLTRVCKEKDAAMLVGGLYDEGEKSFSATYLITEDGGYDVYKKQQLVPFGEYIPFKEGLTWLFPTLFEKRNIDGGLSSGKRQEPLEYRNIKLGCVLCFDSVFSSYTRYATQHGAHILCVSTNDSWFSLSTAKRQHMAQSVIRAVENRRFVVRSASDGISAVIDDRGRIVAVAEHEDPTVFDAQIKLYRDKTLYTRFGDIPVLMLAALCVLAGIFLKEEKS